MEAEISITPLPYLLSNHSLRRLFEAFQHHHHHHHHLIISIVRRTLSLSLSFIGNWVHVNKKHNNIPPDSSQEEESLDIVSCFGVGEEYQNLGDNLQISSELQPPPLQTKIPERFGGMIRLGFDKVPTTGPSPTIRSSSPATSLDTAGSFIMMDRTSSRGSFVVDEPWPVLEAVAASREEISELQSLLLGMSEVQSMTRNQSDQTTMSASMLSSNDHDTIQGSIISASTDPVLDSLVLPVTPNVQNMPDLNDIYKAHILPIIEKKSSNLPKSAKSSSNLIEVLTGYFRKGLEELGDLFTELKEEKASDSM